MLIVGPDGATSTLGRPAGSGVATLELGNGVVVTAYSSGGAVVIGSVTLSVGEGTTLAGGQSVSLGPSGLVVVSGTAASTAVFGGPTGTGTGTGTGSSEQPSDTGFPGSGSRAGHSWGCVGLGIALAFVLA